MLQRCGYGHDLLARTNRLSALDPTPCKRDRARHAERPHDLCEPLRALRLREFAQGALNRAARKTLCHCEAAASVNCGGTKKPQLRSVDSDGRCTGVLPGGYDLNLVEGQFDVRFFDYSSQVAARRKVTDAICSRVG